MGKAMISGGGSGSGNIIDLDKYKTISLQGQNYDYNNTTKGFLKINNITITETLGRGHTVIILDRYTLNTIEITQYDTYGTPGLGTTIANKMNALDDSKIVILISFDATSCNGDLRNALTRCGSNKTGTWTQVRYSHIFMGIPNSSSGSAYENYASGSSLLTYTATIYYNERKSVQGVVSAFIL